MFAFKFKKFISFFLEPLSISVALIIIGLYFLYKKDANSKCAKKFISVGLFSLLLFSWPPLGHILLHPLESQHSAYKEIIPGDNFEYIAVLGSAHGTDSRLPATAQLGMQSLARVTEGVRLKRLFPGAKLIFCGYAGSDPRPHSEAAAQAAVEMGIKAEDIIKLPEPRDTMEESLAIKKIVKGQSFLLVTSASHMLRSMGLFKKCGTKPIAAPTEFIN
ncbi:MAG: YdcF family protein, partial [Lentisphaeraceae bacterium]|nr:YdcF family protein [Lentisphaeraceae bacterium]